jgi:hypothetical protein
MEAGEDGIRRLRSIAPMIHRERARDLTPPGGPYNPARKQLGARGMENLNAIIAPFDRDLDALGRWSAEHFVAYTTTLWKEQRFWRCPCVAVDPPKPPGKRFMLMRAYTAGIWKVSFALYEGDDAVFDEIWAEINEHREARSEAVHAYIAAL